MEFPFIFHLSINIGSEKLHLRLLWWPRQLSTYVINIGLVSQTGLSLSQD